MYSNNDFKLYALATIMEGKISDKDKAELIEGLKGASLPQVLAFLNVGQTYVGPLNEKVERIILAKFLSNDKLIESIDNFMFDLEASKILKEEDYGITQSTFNLNPLKKDFYQRDLSTKYGSVTQKQWKDRITGDWHQKWDADLSDKAKDLMSITGKVGAALVATMIVAFAYKFYKKHFTEKGKICGQLKGKSKIQCEAKVTIEGLNLAIQKMNSLKSSKCSKSKDPAECKKKVDEKIQKYQGKINKYKSVL